MTVPIAQTAIATDIPLPPDADDGLVAAVEVRLGRAVVVIVEHIDGCIGIGNVVQRVDEDDRSVRNRCLEYAIGRVVTLQTQRRERSEERRRAKSSAQRREYR